MTILTQETIFNTRQWFADNAQDCIVQAVSGEVKVNNLDDYIESKETHIEECLSGVWDHTFTFQQRALYFQTGVCNPLLP